MGLLQDIKDTVFDTIQKSMSTVFKDTAKEIFEDLKNFDNMSSSIARTMGQTRDVSTQIRMAFGEAYQSVALLGGKLEDVKDIQESIISITNRNLILNSQAYDKIFAATQVTNKSAGELIETYKDIGVSIYDMTTNVQKSVDVVRQFGVNISKTYEQIVRHTEMMNKYNFENGVEGMAKMAAKAVALRVDMRDTFNFAEKVLNPEGAIEMANAFQRLGVGTSQLLDPLKLMDLSMNDPEELQNQLAKMTEQFTKFNSETGRFEILPGAKRMLRELETATGINYKELTRMSMASAELSDKLSKIRMPDFVKPEQREMIANMAEFSKKAGGYVIQVQTKDDKGTITGTKEKLVTELSKEDIETFAEQSKSKDIIDLTKESTSYQNQMLNELRGIKAAITGGVAISPEGQKLLQTMGEFTTTAGKLLNDRIKPQKVSGNIDKMSDFVKDLSTGGISMRQLLDGAGAAFQNAGTSINNFASDLKTALETNKKFMNAYGADLIQNFDKIMRWMATTAQNASTGQNLPTPIPRQDLIVTSDGVFEPSKDDVIAAFKQGGIISETVQNVTTSELPNTTALIDAMSKIMVNNQPNVPTNNSTQSEMSVKFEPLEIKITSDGNMEQLRIELQRNPELGQLIARNVQKVLSDSMKSELTVKNYSGKPQSIA